MKTTPANDPVPPPERSFGELRCRRYLFDRDWWDPPAPAAREAEPAPDQPPRSAERH